MWVSGVPARTIMRCPEAKEVTGRVFDVTGRALSVSEGWHRGPTIDMPGDDPAKLGSDVLRIVGEASPQRF